MKNLIDVLEERGFIDALSNPTLREEMNKPITLYSGFDPTADSLHLGNLVGIVALGWFKRYGHHPIAIVGGATGMIGDPSGRSAERNLLNSETLQTNLKGIQKSLDSVLNPDGRDSIKILNNYDWFSSISFLEFLREIGKHFRLGTMLAKESVKTRLASEEGISFTEFSYQLLQAYDFLHLYSHHNVKLQIGGSDQWGNITAGTELIRKLKGAEAYGLTFKLLTRSDGKKFGKSEEGAIWLNKDKLSPFDFYQYLVRVPDADVVKLFKMLTYIDMEEINAIEASMNEKNYIPNTAQKRLAEEITKLVHGEEGLSEALRITSLATPGHSTQLDEESLKALSKEVFTLQLSKVELEQTTIADLLVKCELASSKGEAKRLIAGGGVYVNNQKVDENKNTISFDQLIAQKWVLITIGKKKKVVLKVS